MRRPDKDPEVWEAVDPGWEKWRTCDPTSPHWYRSEDFARLVAAYIQHDQAADRRRPVREFLALFDGLASTTRRGKILAELGLNRAVLADLLCDGAPDREAIDALLQAMRAATKPIKPPRLGIIGETNLRRRLGAFGDADLFRYARAIGFDHEGLPYIVEGAFVWTPNQTYRQLILGVNFASAPSLSIDLGLVETVGTLLAERHAGQYEPVAALLHVVHPRPTFTDLGKTQLSLPYAARGDLRKVVEKVSAEWHKQRQREERDRRAVISRRDAFYRSQKTTAKDVVRRHLPAVYERVSGGLGARCRQLFYGLRPYILAETDRDEIDDAYVMYQLIPDFIAENPGLCTDWVVFFDDRGHLIEPHSGRIVGLGTRNVRDYCRGWRKPIISGFELAPPQIGTSRASGSLRCNLIYRKGRL